MRGVRPYGVRMTLDPAAYRDLVARESARCADALAGADLGAPVPTAPGWSVADLAWHLAEVQDSWARIAGGPLVEEDASVPLERPADDAVVELLRSRTARLVAGLAAHPPGTACWSWHPEGGNVAWVHRRQAHEALIHRVDAELAAGLPVSDPSAEVAADGVDELVRVMLDGLPDWATFAPDDARIRLRATDADGSWDLVLGRWAGTSPNTGNVYDEETVQVDRTGEGAPRLLVEGRAWDLDRWLWGRGDISTLAVDGDAGLVRRLRTAITASTQ